MVASVAAQSAGVTQGKRLRFEDPPELLADDASFPPGASLRMVQAVFRNGGRTPLTEKYVPGNVEWRGCDLDLQAINMKFQGVTNNDYVKDLARARSRSNTSRCGPGRMTQAGYAQALALGSWMRRRYLDTANPMLDPVKGFYRGIRSQSTHHRLPITTLHGVLSGVLQQQRGSSGGGARAAPFDMPVFIPPPPQDILAPNKHSCRALGVLMQQAQEQGSASGTAAGRDAAQALRKYVKLPARDDAGWVSWMGLLDAVMCMEAANMTLFPGLDDETYRLVDAEATQRVASVLGPACSGRGPCQKLLQLATGPLLSHLLSHLQSLVECLRQGPAASEVLAAVGDDEGAVAQLCRQRLQLYSGHDLTLISLLAALGHPPKQWPSFMSSVIIELWELPHSDAFVEPKAATLDNHALSHDLFSDEDGVRATVSQASIGAATTFAVRILHDLKPIRILSGPSKPASQSRSLSTEDASAGGTGGGTGGGTDGGTVAKERNSSLLLLRELSDVVLLPYVMRSDDYRLTCSRGVASAVATARTGAGFRGSSRGRSTGRDSSIGSSSGGGSSSTARRFLGGRDAGGSGGRDEEETFLLEGSAL